MLEDVGKRDVTSNIARSTPSPVLIFESVGGSHVSCGAVCFYKRKDVIIMGDFHLWSASTLAEFHRTPTSCRASEYNLPLHSACHDFPLSSPPSSSHALSLRVPFSLIVISLDIVTIFSCGCKFIKSTA